MFSPKFFRRLSHRTSTILRFCSFHVILHPPFLCRLVSNHSFSNFQASSFFPTYHLTSQPISSHSLFRTPSTAQTLLHFGPAAFQAFTRSSAIISAEIFSHGPSAFTTIKALLHSFSSLNSFSSYYFHILIFSSGGIISLPSLLWIHSILTTSFLFFLAVSGQSKEQILRFQIYFVQCSAIFLLSFSLPQPQLL